MLARQAAAPAMDSGAAERDPTTEALRRNFTAAGPSDTTIRPPMTQLRVGGPPPRYRMSQEVWVHYIRQHPCRGRFDVAICPCSASEVLSCAECDEMLLLFLASHRPICEHAGPVLAFASDFQ
jgi:hypothetical protein